MSVLYLANLCFDSFFPTDWCVFPSLLCVGYLIQAFVDQPQVCIWEAIIFLNCEILCAKRNHVFLTTFECLVTLHDHFGK